MVFIKSFLYYILFLFEDDYFFKILIKLMGKIQIIQFFFMMFMKVLFFNSLENLSIFIYLEIYQPNIFSFIKQTFDN